MVNCEEVRVAQVRGGKRRDYEAHTGVTGLTLELSPVEMGVKVPVLLSCDPQVGVADRLNASPSICRIARTMMSRLFLGLGVASATRGLLCLSSSMSDSVSSSSSSSSDGDRSLSRASSDILRARSLSSSALMRSTSFWVANICSSSLEAARSSSKQRGLVALFTLLSCGPSAEPGSLLGQYLDSITRREVFCWTSRSLSWFSRKICSAACWSTAA